MIDAIRCPDKDETFRLTLLRVKNEPNIFITMAPLVSANLFWQQTCDAAEKFNQR